MWPAGTAWSPIRGVVGLRARMSPGYQAGHPSVGAVAPVGLARAPNARETPAGRESGGDADAAAHRHHPRRPGLLPVLGPGGPRPLRGEGQVAAPPAPQLLGRPGGSRPPDRPDDGPGRPRGVGHGRHRGRRAHPRALPHPDPPAAVQRAAEGRQELSLAGGHGERRVAAPGRVPRQEAQGGPLLRPLRPRRRPARDHRPPAAQFPGADLLGRQVRAAPSARSPLPPLRHRALLGPMRRRGGRRALRPPGGRADALPLGRDRAGRGPALSRDAGGGRGARVRAGGPPA